ncbi:hypothetical protein ACLMJK_009667 [Lecanora helva]
MVAPSRRGIALLSVNAAFCVLGTTASILRFVKNLSKAKKGLVPFKHSVITDAFVLTATALVVLNGVFRIICVLTSSALVIIPGARQRFNSVELDGILIDWLQESMDGPSNRVLVLNTGKSWKRIIRDIAYITVAGLFAGSISYYLLECKPCPAAWTPDLGHCMNQRAGCFGTSIANLVTDVLGFSVPVVWLADLRMSLHSKITVGIQLFLGVIVSILSLIRIFFVVNVDSKNITGSVVTADTFSCIELTMAIIFASAAGIVDRETSSDFVHGYIVPRPFGYSEPKDGRAGASEPYQRSVDIKEWQTIDGSVGEASVTVTGGSIV